MSNIGTKEEWDAYLEGYRKFNAWEEEHRRDYMPFDKALEWISSFRRALPADAIAYAESRDTSGFSNLLKLLALIRR